MEACDCTTHPVGVKTSTPGPWRASARVAIGGMHCEECARRVERALWALRGVSHASVRRALGIAIVLYDPALVSEDDLLEAIADAGKAVHQYRGIVLL